MNNIKRIEVLFGLTGLLILAIGLIFFSSTININFHETYLVIASTHIALGLSLNFVLISLIYFYFTKFSKPLNYSLGQIHYLITTLALLIFLFPPEQYFEPQRYYPGSNPFENGLGINKHILFVFFVFIFGQMIFIINILWTLLGREKTTR